MVEGPGAGLAQELALLLPEDAAGLGGLGQAGSAGDQGQGAAQLGQVHAHGAHGGRPALALGGGAGQTLLGGAEAASEGVVGGLEQRGLGLDAEELFQLGRADLAAAAGADPQDQPFDLLSGDPALLGHARGEEVQRRRIEADLVGCQGLAGHAGDIALLVLVAGDGGGGVRLLGRLAQGGVAAERPGLDDQEGVGVELALGVGGQGLGGGLVGGGPLAGQPHADQAPAAHHRQGGQLLLQLAGLIEVGLGQHGDVEGIVQVGGDALGQPVGAFPHPAPVLAVEQHGAEVVRRAFQDAVDVGAFRNDHCGASLAALQRPAQIGPAQTHKFILEFL